MRRVGDRRGCCLLAHLACAAALLGAALDCGAADLWGGSLGVTNDYLVRGISRSDDEAAVQADVHYVSTSGLVAGVFASTAKTDHYASTAAELGPFLGFAWSVADDWHWKAFIGHYAYFRPHSDADYDYDELTVDAAFNDWLDLSVAYSPNFRRYVPEYGLVRGGSSSADLNLQHPIYRNLYATGGVGYSYQSGPGAAGYVYWSVGASYNLAPVALALSYIDTSAAAKSLFYEEVATGRWAATVIWRF